MQPSGSACSGLLFGRMGVATTGGSLEIFASKTFAALLASVLLAGPAAAFKACQVTDTGGVDDKGFNQTAWKGVKDAEEDLGIEGKLLESKAETDYEPNINSFLAEKLRPDHHRRLPARRRHQGGGRSQPRRQIHDRRLRL